MDGEPPGQTPVRARPSFYDYYFLIPMLSGIECAGRYNSSLAETNETLEIARSYSSRDSRQIWGHLRGALSEKRHRKSRKTELKKGDTAARASLVFDLSEGKIRRVIAESVEPY